MSTHRAMTSFEYREILCVLDPLNPLELFSGILMLIKQAYLLSDHLFSSPPVADVI
jgi:hypothetical protein